MTDHEAARRLFATSLDFPLDQADRDQLDAHLRDCPTCRSYTAALRSDAAVLRDLDVGPVPIAVRADVAIAAEGHDRGGGLGRWLVLVGVGALLLVAVTAGTLGGGGQRKASGDPGQAADPGANAQISWKTDVVTLAAREFSIDVDHKIFRAAAPKVGVTSDPGNATYRTLEATWQENGVEMRLNLYFGGDASSWWVNEIRIYNGNADAKWLYAKGTYFRTLIGAGWTGDIDITMTDVDGVGGTPAHVHFAGLTLESRPFDGVNEPVGGGIALPQNGRPFAPGGPLHCSGILQMPPRQAEETLLALGYRLSWRLERTTGPNMGFAEIRRQAPDGIIIGEPIGGSEGELIVSVATPGDPLAVPVALPADCPRSDPNLPPPPPAP